MSTRERQKDKWPILNFSQGDKIHWFPGPYSTEASKAGKSEIGATRGSQGPPNLGSHTEVPSAPRKKELTLLRLVPLLKWTVNESETTFLEIS